MSVAARPLKSSTVVVMLLVVACVAVDFAVVNEVAAERVTWPHTMGAVDIGLAIGQMCLLVVWFVWGTRRVSVFWRAAICTSGYFGLSWMMARGEDYSDPTGEYFFISLLYVVVVAAVLFPARILGYKIHDRSSSDTELVTVGRPIRFSIWNLLSTTTAVCVLLGLLRFIEPPNGPWLMPSGFFLVLAVTTCLILFVSFRWHWFRAAITVAIVSPLAGEALHAFTEYHASTPYIIFVAAACTNVFAGVRVLRSAGFALRRVRPIIATTATQSEPHSVSESSPQHAEP